MIMFVMVQIAYSQTAVYFCYNTGVVGYCVGNNAVGPCAYNKCIGYGGYNPQIILFNYSKGYGAIAIGYNNLGKTVVGASAGYSSLYDAERVAKAACISNGGYGVYIYDRWADF